MRARSTVVRTKDRQLATPLLVPSFSSKGFAFRDDGLSTVAGDLEFAAPSLNDTMLLSAYDLHHRHLPEVECFFGDFIGSVYSNPSLLFIDSGGYETSDDYDLSDVRQAPITSKGLPETAYPEMVDRFSDEVSETQVVLVNQDRYGDYGLQIEQAQRFFAQRPAGFYTDLLLKPRASGAFHDLSTLFPHCRNLAMFTFIGVTEKELGDSILDRMVTVARLRDMLDAHDVPAPIHVFGALDPLFCWLYFLAGAEIFDGLTWLRYSYVNGLSVYAESRAVISGNLHLRGEQRRSRWQLDNLDQLARLGSQMRRFCKGGTFEPLGEGSTTIRNAYETLLAEVGDC